MGITIPYAGMLTPPRGFDVPRHEGSSTSPPHVRQCPIKQALLMHIVVLQGHGDAMGTRICPDRMVVGFVPVDVADRHGTGTQIRQASNECV